MRTYETSDIMKTYSGKDGKCCCGCSGKYYYNSLHVEEGSKNRGYKVTKEDINDTQVTRILNKILNTEFEEERTYISTVIGKRLYIAYLTEKAQNE